MNYRNWFAVSINMNKERSCREQLLARKAVLKDVNLLEVEYLQRKELTVDKSGKRKVKNKLLMSGYLLVQVKMEEYQDEMGITKTRFPGETFDLIVDTPGIKFFVNCDAKNPIAFRPREIKRLFDMCDEAQLDAAINLKEEYNEGDILDVIEGPFKGNKCEVYAVQGDKIFGHIDLFGRTVPAEFTKFQVYKTA